VRPCPCSFCICSCFFSPAPDITFLTYHACLCTCLLRKDSTFSQDYCCSYLHLRRLPSLSYITSAPTIIAIPFQRRLYRCLICRAIRGCRHRLRCQRRHASCRCSSDTRFPCPSPQAAIDGCQVTLLWRAALRCYVMARYDASACFISGARHCCLRRFYGVVSSRSRQVEAARCLAFPFAMPMAEAGGVGRSRFISHATRHAFIMRLRGKRVYFRSRLTLS